VNNERIRGPTLTILFDQSSPYRNRVSDVVLLYRKCARAEEATAEESVFRETKLAIEKADERIRVDRRIWVAEDPTDHKAIYGFLTDILPKIRQQFSDRELVIHVSPGTPSMQTVWVLLGECGFISEPFKVVKSYRAGERHGGPSVVPVEIGIETFYKRYRESRPQVPITSVRR
jgi:sigma54-dependent transcription regulator